MSHPVPPAPAVDYAAVFDALETARKRLDRARELQTVGWDPAEHLKAFRAALLYALDETGGQDG